MSKKSTLVFVARMFLIISSMASISSMLYMNWRRMRVFCRISQQTVQAAYDIARFTAEDPMAGLPDAADIAQPGTHRDLQLFHPWDLTSEAAAELALQCEEAALRTQIGRAHV